MSEIEETRQSDKSPVERNTQQRKIKNQKHSRMKIFAKITSRQMGS